MSVYAVYCRLHPKTCPFIPFDPCDPCALTLMTVNKPTTERTAIKTVPYCIIWGRGGGGGGEEREREREREIER